MELRAIRQAEAADISKKPKLLVSQMVGTELQNVKKPIVYLNEHGQNVLRNVEVQGETVIVKVEQADS